MNLVYAQSRVLSDVSERVNCVFDFIAHLFAEHQLIKARASLEMICEELKGTHSFSKSILNLEQISDPIQAAINVNHLEIYALCPSPFFSFLRVQARAYHFQSELCQTKVSLTLIVRSKILKA